jgi:hypothetical protein
MRVTVLSVRCARATSTIDDLRNTSKLLLPLTCLGIVFRRSMYRVVGALSVLDSRSADVCHLHCMIGMRWTNDVRPRSS